LLSGNMSPPELYWRALRQQSSENQLNRSLPIFQSLISSGGSR
jgi:hypothetical protein